MRHDVANFEAIYVSVDRTLQIQRLLRRITMARHANWNNIFQNGFDGQLKVIDSPTLVVLDPKTGYVVTTNGVAEVKPWEIWRGSKIGAKRWKKTKPVPASDLKMDMTLKNGNMERGIVRWEETQKIM
jgi:hypothetical protein